MEASADSIQGISFHLEFMLDEHEKVEDNAFYQKNILSKSSVPHLIGGSGGELQGLDARFYFDIADSNGEGLGEVVGHISEVFIKLKQAKEHTEQIDFLLTELIDWVALGKVRLLYRVAERADQPSHFYYIPLPRLCRIIKAYYLNTVQSRSL